MIMKEISTGAGQTWLSYKEAVLHCYLSDNSIHRSLYVIFIHTVCLECMQYLSSALHSSKAIDHTCASHMKPNYFSNFQVLFTLNKDYTNGSTSLSCFMYVKQLYVRREYSALPLSVYDNYGYYQYGEICSQSLVKS